MTEMPSVLALRPGATISRTDRATLRKAGIIVVQVSPEDLVAIQAVSVVPMSAMLRCALQTIKDAPVGGYQKELRADFAKRLIDAYIEFDRVSPSPAPGAEP